MKINRLYEVVERKIGGAFAAYGRFVSRHAWKILIVTVIINAALGVGMLNLQSDIATDNVYLPQGTESREDQAKVDDIFPNLSGSSFNKLQVSIVKGLYARVIVRSTSGNLLDRAVLEDIRTLSDVIEDTTANNDDGSIIKFADICAIINGHCAVEGVVFWSSDFLTAVDDNNVTYPVFVSETTGNHNLVSEIGGAIQLDNSETYLSGMEYLRIKYNMRTDEVKYKDMCAKWVAELVLRLESYPSSNNFEFAYGHYASLDEEIDKTVSGDISLFAATIALMVTYACVATLSSRVTDQVGQRIWLGFAGILAAGLAIVSSFGLCAAVGVDYVSIVGIVPFLVLGIGIDDMFILLSGLSEAQSKTTVEEKMAETLRISGVGITITSLTDFIAFMAGVGSSFIAVKNFCIYTGVAVLFCYVNNVTFFASCIAINERRVGKNRHYMTCRRIKTKEILRTESKSKPYVLCCGGRAPRNREEAESFIDKIPRWIIPKIVLKLPFKIIILVLFTGYLAAAIYGCIHLKQGLLFTQLVHDESYFFKYSDWEEINFQRNVPVAFVFPNIYDYSNSTVVTMIDDLVSNAQSNRYFDNDFEVNWFKTYSTSMYYDGASESAFISGLTRFIDDPRYAIFKNDVIIDSVNEIVTSSRIYVLSADMADSQEEGKMMLESRDIASAASIECFAFAPAFVAYEQYVRILGQTMFSVGIALAAVFVITCIFMPHPVLILFVTVVVAMIMIGVFGFIFYIDVALSSITMIHMIMSIGFSIDFTAHICHGYMISNGVTRDERVTQAIDKTGAPIFHGAVSSLLGILLLVAAKSYIFRTFAAVMAFVLLFGIAHALFLLPVILSWIGPGRLHPANEVSKLSRDANAMSNRKQNGFIDTDGINISVVSKTLSAADGAESRTDRQTKASDIDMINFRKYASVYKLKSPESDNAWTWKDVTKTY